MSTTKEMNKPSSPATSARIPPAARTGHGRGPFPLGVHIDAAKDFRKTFRRLLCYFSGHTVLIFTSVLFIITGVLLRALTPALIGAAIKNDLELSKDMHDFLHRMAVILSVVVGAWIADAVSGVLMTRLSNMVVFRMRADSFAHVQTLSMGSFDRRGIGDFISRMTNDVEMVFNAMNNGFVSLVGGLFSMIGVLAAMILLSVPLSLVVVGVVPVMAVVTGVMGKRIREAFRRNQEWVGRLSAEIEESVSGLKVIKTFRREETEYRKFERINGASQRAGVEAELVSYAFMPVMNIMTSLTLGLIVGVGGFLALGGIADTTALRAADAGNAGAAGGVSIGLLTAFILYSQRFFEPLRQITQVYNMIQSAVAGAERLFELMDTKPEVVEKPDALPLNDVRGAVEFQNVSFAYEAGKTILDDISFRVEAGQVIAIVGPTGAGKTTLINLLGRFYDVQKGYIAIDGKNTRDLIVDELRTSMGVVLQEPFFFATTIRENLLYARPDATEEQMVAAAKTANAHYFISRLPYGYDTVLSERGSNLSQGERQLLGIARAILARPSILVLDEATSSVDSLTESHIQEGLIRLMKGRTSFIIAHRLSTIRKADRVLVLHNQRIIESGTHEELMAKPGGFYAKLYSMQDRKPEIKGSDFEAAEV